LSFVRYLMLLYYTVMFSSVYCRPVAPRQTGSRSRK